MGEIIRSSGAVRSIAVAMARKFLDALAPPLCPVTGERVAAPGLLSATGWSQLQFIDDPVCARCGAPFSHDIGEGAECAGCLADPPDFDGARAAVVYNDGSHGLIVAYKHADRTDLTPLLANWLVRAGRSAMIEGAVLTAVPLHPRRLFARRYNQAALLAAAAARMTGLDFDPMILERTRATPPQKDLSPAARRRNVAGAIDVRKSRMDAVAGRRFIIVDDVLTTGATLSACARALKRRGAARVDALALARVVKGGTALG